MLKSLVAKACAIGVTAVVLMPLGAQAEVPKDTPDTRESVSSSAVAPLDESTQAQFRSEFERYGVPLEKQEELIANHEAGKLWDSNSGATAVTTESNAAGETIQRFADGSIAVTSVEQPAATQGEVTPMAVSRCRAVPGSGGYQKRVDCLVNKNTVQTNQSFEADYQVKSGAAGRILAVRNPVYWCYFPGCKMSSPDLRITRSTSSGSTPATARMTQQITYTNPANGNDIISSTLWVQLNVTTSARSSNN